MNKLEHPLFPAKDEGDDPPEIGNISISRFNPVTGRSPFVPRMFSADEIRDLSQIAALFGGGTYELTGRNLEGNRIVAKRVYEIAGESKPLVAESPKPPPEAPMHLPAPQQQAPAGGQMNLAAVLPIVVPIVLQYLQNAAADRREQQASERATTMAMMQQQQASSQAFIQAMSNLQPRGGGHGDDFRAGISFCENFIAGKLEGAQAASGGETDAKEIMQTIGQAFEMMRLTEPGGVPPASPPVGT